MREKNPVTHDEKLAYLRELREAAIHSSSEEAVEKQHAKGKMTARERVEKLLDPGSFECCRIVSPASWWRWHGPGRSWPDAGDAVRRTSSAARGARMPVGPRTSPEASSGPSVRRTTRCAGAQRRQISRRPPVRQYSPASRAKNPPSTRYRRIEA